MIDDSHQSMTLSSWRTKGLALLRITFGLVWAVDAWFKWQPAFINDLTSYLTGALPGQPAQIRAWIHFWHHIIGIDPRLFAYLVAIGETVLAATLILGAFMGLSSLLGFALTVIIWTTAEGFGGPYAPGSADIGAAIIYALVFVGLYLAQAGLIWGLDRRLTPLLGNWSWIASGPFHRPKGPRIGTRRAIPVTASKPLLP